MLVKNWMSTKVITVDADDSMSHAVKLLKEHNIHMLPVMKQGKLVGVVSDSDIKRASASDATSLDVHELLYLISKIRIQDIMTKNPITVPPDYTVEETAEIMMTKKISGIPVVDESGQVVGIITKDDLFNVLISLSGFGKRGVQLAFYVEDRPGSIKELTDVVRGYGARIASILTSYERVSPGFRTVYLRVYEINRDDLPRLLEELKNKAELLYVVDHRDNKRIVYQDLPK